MGDRAACIAAYEKAAKIADKLLAEGVPVVGFSDFDMGASIGLLFQLRDNPAKYGCRLKLEEATVERFRELYEAVA